MSKEWEPPIVWPSWHRQRPRWPNHPITTKAVIVRENGNAFLLQHQVEENAIRQALNIFKGCGFDDLQVLEIHRLKTLDGWVVIVQNKI